jgi:hypothetical protein
MWGFAHTLIVTVHDDSNFRNCCFFITSSPAGLAATTHFTPAHAHNHTPPSHVRPTLLFLSVSLTSSSPLPSPFLRAPLARPTLSSLAFLADVGLTAITSTPARSLSRGAGAKGQRPGVMPPKKTFAKGWKDVGSKVRIPGKPGKTPDYVGIVAWAGVTDPPFNEDKPDTKCVVAMSHALATPVHCSSLLCFHPFEI